MKHLNISKTRCSGSALGSSIRKIQFPASLKTGKTNVKADTLSHIPWQQADLECTDLECQTVKAIMMGCTAETPLFEAYSRKMVQAEGFQVISSQENALVLAKWKLAKLLPLLDKSG